MLRACVGSEVPIIIITYKRSVLADFELTWTRLTLHGKDVTNLGMTWTELILPDTGVRLLLTLSWPELGWPCMMMVLPT